MVPRKKVDDEKNFIFCNGKRANTVASLKREIKNLSDDEYSFHVNENKNDFYNWIRDCINPMFAESISGPKSKKELLALLK